MRPRVGSCVVLGLAIALVVPTSLRAQAPPAEEPKRPWTDSAEFGLINTTGNTETTNFALTNKYVYTWSNADVTVDAAALRVETTTKTAANVDGALVVVESKQTSAETYAIGGKYRRNITESFLWYGRGGWFRNRPAGIDDRYIVGAGIGYRFFKTDVHNLVGELGLDYTDETQTTGLSDEFAGTRGFLGYERNLSATAKFNTELELLGNLDSSDDWRANFVASVTATMTKKLALKASYRILYDNEPVVETIPDTVLPIGPDVLFEHDEMDTILSVSLVINF